MLFRESVIAFITGGVEPSEYAKSTPQSEYCEMCKRIGIDDCENCDPTTIVAH